jgi:hypothetical protein
LWFFSREPTMLRTARVVAAAAIFCGLCAGGIFGAEPPGEEKLTPLGKFTGPIELGLPGMIGVVLPQKFVDDAPTQAASIRIVSGARNPRAIYNYVVSCRIADEAKIRVPPRVQYDKLGRPVKEETPDRRDPDRKLGGVAGKVAELRTGDVATVWVARTSKGEYVATVIQVVGRNEPSGPLKALSGNVLQNP